jgi:hypothetical protein
MWFLIEAGPYIVAVIQWGTAIGLGTVATGYWILNR